jgi:hypothetical protein
VAIWHKLQKEREVFEFLEKQMGFINNSIIEKESYLSLIKNTRPSIS